MPTLKQQLAIAKLVENRGTSIGQAMRDAGYTPATAKNPQNLTNSIGFKEALEEYGLTEELITRALVDDIKSKPKKRFYELSLGADILGMKKQSDTGGNKTLVVVVTGQTVQRYGITIPQDPSGGST